MLFGAQANWRSNSTRKRRELGSGGGLTAQAADRRTSDEVWPQSWPQSRNAAVLRGHCAQSNCEGSGAEAPLLPVCDELVRAKVSRANALPGSTCCCRVAVVCLFVAVVCCGSCTGRPQKKTNFRRKHVRLESFDLCLEMYQTLDGLRLIFILFSSLFSFAQDASPVALWECTEGCELDVNPMASGRTGRTRWTAGQARRAGATG